MRKQLCTSSELSNWTLAASVPGLSWVMNTWKWRTLQLPYRPTGQTEGGEDQKKKLECLVEFLFIIREWSYIRSIVPSFFLSFFSLSRHAIEVNKRDYRAWYGLGQTYEILKMPFYCLYYYRKAHQLRYGSWQRERAFFYKSSPESKYFLKRKKVNTWTVINHKQALFALTWDDFLLQT